MTLTEELRYLSRHLAVLAALAATSEQGELFHRTSKRRTGFIRDEIADAADILKARSQTIQAPAFQFQPGENQ